MPLQNRVTPFGAIVAVPERGTLMGNRGILHDAAGALRRRWATRAWICCLLEFRGRRDPVMAPGHYTRLFFLDEPTALAAGHRPCAYCRREAYRSFRAAWAAGSAHLGLGTEPRAAEIDRVLHAERLGPDGSKRLHPAELADLPDGAFVLEDIEGGPEDGPYVRSDGEATRVSPPARPEDGPLPPALQAPRALLLWHGDLWRWAPGGYARCGPIRPRSVLALTPPSIVRALGSGYRPGPPAGLGA
jgi:hypothetical protein